MSMDLAQSLAAFPPFVADLLDRAIRELQVEKVWLFGSRARGDALPRSDFDLAFVVPPDRRDAWPPFCAGVEEDARTLHQIDLLRWDSAPEEMRQRILAEGVLLYERT
ncbi:MAG: nucleotidyltransferase domain-containing protein [Deltaproteobacteria bacterium]|nr:nucleotidyltransferase domain-containing protein [Deltaproteobacteria bacterium]